MTPRFLRAVYSGKTQIWISLIDGATGVRVCRRAFGATSIALCSITVAALEPVHFRAERSLRQVRPVTVSSIRLRRKSGNGIRKKWHVDRPDKKLPEVDVERGSGPRSVFTSDCMRPDVLFSASYC